MIIQSCFDLTDLEFFTDQFAADTMSTLHDSLLLSGCVLNFLSGPDKNKHGKHSINIKLICKFPVFLFLDGNTSTDLNKLSCFQDTIYLVEGICENPERYDMFCVMTITCSHYLSFRFL